ncbi:hypothetical protein MPDQ_005351 [Monascus purpureus]|uniref:Uncharacterized protein n=1 Tax=Monascus purpureus TaxID=5098 RepID=A0A507QKN9_MONPU|nr:hypothetical protein MPDQ_005351 [Monascus purpureus]
MIPSSFPQTLSRRDTGKSSLGHDSTPHPALASGSGTLVPQSAGAIYQHIHDMASKRISTLDYLRKAHEGRIYWFNTVRFSKADLGRMPYFEHRKLSRRAVNYLLLGMSLPPILDVNSTAFEYLRALNALLLEFETFQQTHPPERGSSSGLARSRIPQMFRRATHAGIKTRRASSANDIGLPMQSSDPSDLKTMAWNVASPTTAASVVSFPHTDASDLLPGEEYSYLLTPSLPFEPDFFETFATLCDVLIDCYTRLMSLVSTPSVCTVALGESFSKADAKLRKVILSGIVREFEDASRTAAKNEIAGVSRVVLGGLLG